MNNRILLLISNPDHSPWIGLVVRLIIGWLLPYLLDGGRFIPGVSYTDIDYLVFTDAAQYILDGQSPYDRHTYRYTPFLASLLSKLGNKQMGRYIFCAADAICGYIILQMRQSRRKIQQSEEQCTAISLWEDNLQDAIWWLYNPLAINICTRGSSESLMVLLPVLMTYWVATLHSRKRKPSPLRPSILQVLVTGILHGIAIHSKLYPVIYSLSYMAYFATTTASSTSRTSSLTTAFPWTKPMKLIRLAQLWMYRLFCTPLPVLFLISSIGTFAGLTYLAVHYYGPVALQEGLLYHFSRVDHRHNYSMYWYWIYLARGKVEGHAAATTIAASSSSSFSVLGRVLLLPQVFLLAYSSIGIAPYNNNLGLALFVQTFLFVTNNKVITAQYFTWYLCLLPLCTTITIQPSSSSPRSKIRVIKALIILLLSIGLWLGSAYLLEMQGLAVHLLVWMSSVLYYFANVHLMGVLLSIQSSSKSNQTGITSNNRTKKVN